MKVLIVEHDFSSQNCTTKGLYHAVPDLKALGCEIDVLSNTYEKHADVTRHIPCFAMKRPWFFRYLSFILVANLKGVFTKLTNDYDIIHTSNGLFLKANLSTFHFSEWDWVKTQLQYLKPNNVKSLYEFTTSIFAAAVDFLQLRRRNLKIVAVSDSIAELLSLKTNSRHEVGVLPNAVDDSKFGRHPELDQSRIVIREKFEIKEDEQVFCFCANGTHRRKGFWLALEALALLPEEFKFKFMLIGGS